MAPEHRSRNRYFGVSRLLSGTLGRAVPTDSPSGSSRSTPRRASAPARPPALARRRPLQKRRRAGPARRARAERPLGGTSVFGTPRRRAISSEPRPAARSAPTCIASWISVSGVLDERATEAAEQTGVRAAQSSRFTSRAGAGAWEGFRNARFPRARARALAENLMKSRGISVKAGLVHRRRLSTRASTAVPPPAGGFADDPRATVHKLDVVALAAKLDGDLLLEAPARELRGTRLAWPSAETTRRLGLLGRAEPVDVRSRPVVRRAVVAVAVQQRRRSARIAGLVRALAHATVAHRGRQRGAVSTASRSRCPVRIAYAPGRSWPSSP